MKLVETTSSNFKPITVIFETDEEARIIRSILGALCSSKGSPNTQLYEILEQELVKQGYNHSYETSEYNILEKYNIRGHING